MWLIASPPSSPPSPRCSALLSAPRGGTAAPRSRSEAGGDEAAARAPPAPRPAAGSRPRRPRRQVKGLRFCSLLGERAHAAGAPNRDAVSDTGALCVCGCWRGPAGRARSPQVLPGWRGAAVAPSRCAGLKVH